MKVFNWNLYGPVLIVIVLILMGGVAPQAAAQSGATATPALEPTKTPAGSLPYLTEEVIFENDDLNLGGTLTLPPGDGPHPALITVTGSGAQDRNNSGANLPDYQPFRELAGDLARRGIAVLRYDDRGVGESTGDITTATPVELATDVEAALTYLQDRKEIDAEQIGLLGHSEGAVVAAMVAARNPGIAFVVSLSGPAISGFELLQEALQRRVETAADPDHVAALADLEIAASELAMAGKWEDLEDHLYQIILQQFQTLTKEQQATIDDPEDIARKLAQKTVNTTYRNPRYLFTMTHNPGEDWAKIEIPVLALFAEFDDNVMAGRNKAALLEAFSETGNEDTVIEVVSGVNHLFLKSDSADWQEWANLPQNLAPEVTDMIGDWISEHVGVNSPDSDSK